MLTEFLQDHPVRELLAGGTRVLFPPADDRRAWEGIPEGYRREIRELAGKYAAVTWPARTASGFLAFVKTGSRRADEDPYFTRRRKLCAEVLGACLDPDAGMDDIVDGIWMICEESTWVISAHNVNPIPGAPAAAEYPLPDIRKPYVDLFCAQTGMILSLTASLLGKRLDAVSPLVRKRIREEIRRRILRPFMATDDFWWMGFRRKDLNNWTPWILSNIMVCAVYDPMPRAKLAAVLERACGMLDRYLDTLPEDGGCDEGAGYWNMAGGALLDCLEILEKVTGGKMTFRQEKKIRNIMAFPAKMEMGGGWFANFADCDARPNISGERLETAGQMLGDQALAALGARMPATVAGQLNDTPHLTRALDLIFHIPAETAPAAEPGDTWLPDLQVRLVRRGSWTLACKGGHNGESHNHNDVGSFILFRNGEPAVVDAGNMVYTAKTFSSERYTLWNVQAEWHNLPVVGGHAQKQGKDHAARNVKRTPDGMELDLAGAYEEAAGIRSLRRTFALGEGGLKLADEGLLREAQETEWIFLLREKPEWINGTVRAGSLEIRCPEGLEFSAEEKPVTDARMARNWPGSLWRVHLRGRKTDRFRMEFVFSASGREA
ncbi:heparinase II/III family protein [Clostridiales bacterium]|nr:heparinase II/III family protein [Clostridiales bacterium]